MVGWIVEKAFAACRETGARILVTGGGVMANSLLRTRLAEEAGAKGVKLYVPALKYTTDNAAMVARNGLEIFAQSGPAPFDFVADPGLAIGG